MWSSPSQAPSTLQMLLTQVARCLPAGGKNTRCTSADATEQRGRRVRVEHRRVTSAQVGRAGPPRVGVFLCPPSLPSLQPSPPPSLPPPAPPPLPLSSQKLQTSARLKQKAAASHLGPRCPFLWRRPMRQTGVLIFFPFCFFSFIFFPS